MKLEYPSQKGSESSSSGSSPHTDEDDEKQGQSSRSSAIPKNKPDLSLKPKLITLSTPVSTPHQRMHRKSRHTHSLTSNPAGLRSKHLTTYPTQMTLHLSLTITVKMEILYQKE